MSSITIVIIALIIYFLALIAFIRLAPNKGGNDGFYRGQGKSPWYLVAFGMIGASISGVTFVSVPGMVNTLGMTYLQTCMGFIVGYMVVAWVLLPVYYRLQLTSIYAYLEKRLGHESHQTGAWIFLVSKMSGASVRFFVACMLLQQFVGNVVGIPFAVTVAILVCMIWFYTRKGGIKTLVWTDTFQTICMFTALLLMLWQAKEALGLDWSQTYHTLMNDARSRIFVFDDWQNRQYFWKQFISGIFIVVVMTGLDQDMMQKNLTCKSLKEAQKDMISYGFAFVPANFLFLSLGILLSIICVQRGMPLPEMGDKLLPMMISSDIMGPLSLLLFTIGVVAASLSSADSALTSLTTIYCVDIAKRSNDEPLRRRVHSVMAVLFAICIMLVNSFNSTSVIDAVYTLVAYTFGPLLGIFGFALFTRRKLHGKGVIYVSLLAPIYCGILDYATRQWGSYRFGYELLLLNGLLTFVGLCAISDSGKQQSVSVADNNCLEEDKTDR